MPYPVFVSFSITGDAASRSFVRLLLIRLSDQPQLDVWIYESPGGRISAGDSIADQCRQRIDGSEMFVLVVNERALESDYVAMEVSHALWVRQHRPLKILPVIATAVPSTNWPPHLREAVGFRGFRTSLLVDDVERLVMDICLASDTPYVPTPPGDARLPLRNRLVDELRGLRSSTQHDVEDMARLLKRCDLALQALADGQTRKARRLAEAMATDIDVDYGGFRPYYLRIFEAMTILAEAQASQASFAEAHAAFDAIVAEAGSSLDANAYAGRGHAALELGRYDAALADYAQAQALLQSFDPALIYSQIRAYILSRHAVPRSALAELEQKLNSGMPAQHLGEASRIASVVCLAHAYGGDIDGVRRCWDLVADASDVFPEIACEVAHWLEMYAGFQGSMALGLAQRILQERYTEAAACTPNARLQLARKLCHVEVALGLDGPADTRLASLMAEFPGHVLLALDAAMLALARRDFAAAHTHCLAAVAVRDHTACSPPLDAVSFERAKGQAYWLLGRDAEASECHHRSGLARDLWYGNTMPGHHALARKG